MAEQAKPLRLARFAWRHVPSLFSLAAFVLVRLLSGSWWWALLAALLAPAIPITAFVIQGIRDARRTDAQPRRFIPVPEIEDDEQSRVLAAQLRASREDLIRSRSARVELVRVAEFEQPDLGRGPLAWGLHKFMDVLRHQVGEGVIDLSRNRAMTDYGFYALSVDGSSEYAGMAGSPLQPRDDADSLPVERPTPLWFITALGLATRAVVVGEDEIDGAPCDRLSVLLDLSAAARQGIPELRVPEWPDARTVPMVVWLEQNESALRRLRYEETPGITYTLTVRDVGLDLAGLDWERFGTFRTADDKLRGSPNVV
jgi:hypothetical protein